MNNGESLGYYLPPNSDEFSLRFESMLLPGTKVHLQYQMIRHGVEYGDGAVDGSSLNDKLADEVGSSKRKYDDNTHKDFLNDGVYQWDHVVKAGGTYSLKSRNIPVSLFGEAGVVITRFTEKGRPDPDNNPSGPWDYSVYKDSTGFILSFGFRLYP
jgi:hypothetical protein